MLQSFAQPLVAWERRCDNGHLQTQIGAVDQELADKLGQVEFFLRDVESQMVRVDSSHVQIGKIAHDADGEGDLEARFLGVSVGAAQRCQAIRPL